MLRRTIIAAALVGMLAPWLSGSAQAGDSVAVDPAVDRMDVVTRQMAAYLEALPSFQVETTTNWAIDTEPPRTGTTRCRLLVQHPTSFRLEIRPDTPEKVTLICASDGAQLTRFYQSGRTAIYSRRDGGLREVLDDELTDSSLLGTGLNVLLRPNVHRFLMSFASQIKDHGKEEVDGRTAHHFSAAWFGGSQIDFWVSADNEPVLLRWKRNMKLQIGDRLCDLRLDSRLAWKVGVEFDKEQARLDLPEGSVEVKDLQSHLLDGGTAQLIGQPVPELKLITLDGKPWELTPREIPVTVLFFFASWAAPSSEVLPEIRTFIKEYEERGVSFFAVSVGETPETVRSFVAAKKYTLPIVIDEEKSAAAAFRVTSLPVTVLIGKDGTVQAAHIGTSAETRNLIRLDMQKLLEGKKPSVGLRP